MVKNGNSCGQNQYPWKCRLIGQVALAMKHIRHQTTSDTSIHPSQAARTFVVHIPVQTPDNDKSDFASWNTNQRTLPAPNPLRFLRAPHMPRRYVQKKEIALLHAYNSDTVDKGIHHINFVANFDSPDQRVAEKFHKN